MAALLGRTLDRYEILSLLGAGGMGSVYRARDTSLAREVAVKVLPDVASEDPQRMERFNREIRTVARLSHPNIVKLHDFGHAEDVSYAVMELLRGRNLREKMRGRPLPIDEALDIGIAVAEGLGAAHHEGVLHRDVKPENIFITSKGDVKILDFGLARTVLEPDPQADTQTIEPPLTSPGTVLGTTGYMSPEQVRGRSLDARSDIFSLGCVLYEMLSGTNPFRKETRADTMSAILNLNPPPLTDLRPTLPPALDLIVSRCLSKEPNDRFDSARDVAFAMQTLSGYASKGGPPLKNEASSGWDALRKAGFGLAVLGLVLGGGWILSRILPERSTGPRFQPRQLTSASGWEAQPAMSPDGSTVAYCSNESGNKDIWVIDVRGGPALALTNHPASDSSPAWFPDGGSIAFVSDRAGSPGVWKTPRLGGDPAPLIPDAVEPAISPDGSLVAFATPDPSGLLRIAVAPSDGQGHVRVLTGDEDGFWSHESPAWSPDGRTICYSDFRNLWTVDLESGSARPLTREDGTDRDPAWSPDGRGIYFSSMRGGTEALWYVSTSGGQPQRLTLGTGPERDPSSSTDGGIMAYSTFVSTTDVVLLDRDSGTSFTLGGARTDVSPDLSRDGDSVVFVSNRSGKFDLWVQRLDRARPVGAPRRLTDHPGSAAVPRFSADGRMVVYFRVLDGQRDIWRVPVAGGPPRQLTTSEGTDMHPAFSPSDDRLAFISDTEEGTHVWVASFDQDGGLGELRQITRGAEIDMKPDWSPDGRMIAFVRSRDIWIVDANQPGSERPLTRGSGARSVRWDPEGKEVWVSGTWGAERLGLRKVSVARGSPASVEGAVDFGDIDSLGSFSLSADSSLVAYERTWSRGDIWVAETEVGEE